MVIAVAALVGVFLSGLVLNIRERRLADAKLKALTQRIFDTQEEERGRVARELHDSISPDPGGGALHAGTGAAAAVEGRSAGT